MQAEAACLQASVLLPSWHGSCMAACSALGTSYQQRSMPSCMQCLPATAGRLEPNERLKHEKQPFREQHRFRQSCQRFFVSVYCTDFAHTGPKGEHQMSTQGYSAGQDPQDKRNERPRHGLAICLQFVHEMFHTHTSGSVNSSIRSYTLTLMHERYDWLEVCQPRRERH